MLAESGESIMSTPQRPSRRDFLRLSTTATATLAANLGLSPRMYAAGTERFNVALVGAGGRGSGAAADCLRVARHIRLVAIADAFEDRAQASRKALRRYFPDQVDVPDGRLFVGLDAYRKALGCNVDLMIQATPPGFRPLHYRAAVEAGKHVFMEKPCCVDAGGFRSLMVTNKLADRKRLKVGVGLFRRHMPTYIETMKKVHDGALGRIQFLRCYCNMVAWGGGGAARFAPNKDTMSELEYQIRNWRVFDWIGGGRLVEAHCHELDVMDWAMRGHPVEANGMGGRQVTRGRSFGTDYDHHFHEYTYADGTKMYSQCRQMNGCWSPITEHIHTDKTVVDLDGKIRISNFRDRQDQGGSPYCQEHADLLGAIWSDKPYNEGWFGATSSFTAVLGREAAYSGQVVKWDELATKGPGLCPEDLTWDTEAPVRPDENGNYEHLVPVPGVYRPF
jgi:hypothetical protein